MYGLNKNNFWYLCDKTRSTRGIFYFLFAAINLPVFLISALSCSLCSNRIHMWCDYINFLHLNQWNYFLQQFGVSRILLENHNNLRLEKKENERELLCGQFRRYQSRNCCRDVVRALGCFEFSSKNTGAFGPIEMPGSFCRFFNCDHV